MNRAKPLHLPCKPATTGRPRRTCMLTELRAYAGRHRHTWVSFKTERPLGLFVLNMRLLYAQGVLRPCRVRKLEGIAHWTWEIERSPAGTPL